MRIRGSIFWGILVIILAALLLLRQQNIIQDDIFGYFWPAVIILIGVFMIAAYLTRGRAVEGDKVSIPLEAATSAYLKLDHGAGRLNLHSGASSAEILHGVFGGGLDYKTNVSGDRLEVRLRTSPHFWFGWPGEGLDWDVALNKDIPLHLNIDSGASASVFDFSELKIHELTFHTGASSTDMTLPTSAGSTHMEIDAGAASINLRLPTGVSARIRVESGLSSINIDTARFPRLEGNLYQSADYATAANRVDITLKTGVGSVAIH